MSENTIRIVTLPPLRVASFHSFGAQPEHAAWEALQAWAAPRGLLGQPDQHPIYGFNNPSPAPGSPNYGYEFWLVLGADQAVEPEIHVKDFPGGMYAVGHWDGSDAPENGIPRAWERLSHWQEHSRYHMGTHQWLEEHLDNPDQPAGFRLNLYLPVSE